MPEKTRNTRAGGKKERVGQGGRPEIIPAPTRSACLRRAHRQTMQRREVAGRTVMFRMDAARLMLKEQNAQARRLKDVFPQPREGNKRRGNNSTGRGTEGIHDL